MNTGMLWFDNDPKTGLEAKIAKAMKYFQDKYGRVPDMCMVNPAMTPGERVVGTIIVRPYRPVLPGHLWLGMKDEDKKDGR